MRIRNVLSRHGWVLTAILNQMIDLCGRLALLNIDGIYKEARREYKADPNTHLSYLLPPKLFAVIVSSAFLGALSGFHGFPLVLQLNQKRTVNRWIHPWRRGEDSEKIGDDIPLMTFETIDLKYSTIAQQEHNEAAGRVTGKEELGTLLSTHICQL
ncbi:hypothetical protein BJY01DRAFT_252073 [Aspergillus pseudoustus]|uniref:Uncharacterized protein n=1 Tax=Aspergillus pseudoustus TaxID=1810923 RepID=A0ABR4J894_9EURO